MFSAFDKVFTLENAIYLGKGALISLGMAAVSLLLGLVIGVIGSSAKRSKYFLPRLIANVYVEIIRGTPMLLQILIIFSVIPSVYTAFTGEVLRSGINGVDKGQWEACQTLGLSNWQTMKLVILPQAFKRIVPPVISEFITLIKDSSLASCIGAIELLKSAQLLGAQYYEVMSPYCLSAIFYLIMTFSISYLGRYVEGKLAESD